MDEGGEEQRTRIAELIRAFEVSRRAKMVSPGTLRFYAAQFRLFLQYCDTHKLVTVEQMTGAAIRAYLADLADAGHNAGGVHAAWRTLKALLRFFERDWMPDGWKNPIRVVDEPIVPEEYLDPVNVQLVKLLADKCPKTKIGLRDRAILLCLLDTGCRASEFLSIDRADVTLTTGTILVRYGKGRRKFRPVFLSEDSRRALRLYLRGRNDDAPALWLARGGKRLSYWGLRDMIQRRTEAANIEYLKPHGFRRAFTLSLLRARVPETFVQRMGGWSDRTMIDRYAKQIEDDLRAAHEQGSPLRR